VYGVRILGGLFFGTVVGTYSNPHHKNVYSGGRQVTSLYLVLRWVGFEMGNRQPFDSLWVVQSIFTASGGGATLEDAKERVEHRGEVPLGGRGGET